MMRRFAEEEKIDDFNSLSDNECSYENADKFIKWLKPLHIVAKTELEEGSVTKVPEVNDVDLNDAEELSEADKSKIDVSLEEAM